MLAGMAKVLGSLAPGMLIAAPPLGDPNFDRTVVLLAVHGDEGALGFVVNRLAPMSLAELLVLAGYGAAAEAESTPVYLGGPVQPSSGWIVCVDPGLPVGDGVLAVGSRIRVVSSRDAFEALVRDLSGPPAAAPDAARRIVLLGYSGWAPGQLEKEIATGAWLPVPLDEGILFDVALSQKWERAYALLGVSPAGFISMRSAGEA